MPQNFTYFRKYIILKNDYTNINNINPKGHVKIEIRGNKGSIRVNVENCEKDQYYKVYFLKENNGRIEELDLGRIITDERGRSRINIGINLRELESKGFSIKKVNAILIRRGMNVLLGGYIDKDNKSIHEYINNQLISEQQEMPLPLDIKPEEVEGYSDIDHENKDIEESSSSEETEKVSDEYEPEADNEIVEEDIQFEQEEVLEEEQPIEQTEEYKLEEVDRVSEVEDCIEEKEESFHGKTQPLESHHTYESLEYIRRLNHKNQMTNYIMSVLKFFPRVQPLKIYLHGYQWWRIDDDGTDPCRGFLPYYNYLMSSSYKYPFLHNSTTCMNQIRKHRHYLFGFYNERNETKYYVYAVPGRFITEEHPFKGITGFNTWYDSIDGIGYWLLYIDPMTGKIIYPINPMVPTDNTIHP